MILKLILFFIREKQIGAVATPVVNAGGGTYTYTGTVLL